MLNQNVNSLGDALVASIVAKCDEVGFDGKRGARLRAAVADLLGDLFAQRDHDAYGKVLKAYEQAIAKVRV